MRHVHQSQGTSNERQVLRRRGIAVVEGNRLERFLDECGVRSDLEDEVVDLDRNRFALANSVDRQLPTARTRRRAPSKDAGSDPWPP